MGYTVYRIFFEDVWGIGFRIIFPLTNKEPEMGHVAEYWPSKGGLRLLPCSFEAGYRRAHPE